MEQQVDGAILHADTKIQHSKYKSDLEVPSPSTTALPHLSTQLTPGKCARVLQQRCPCCFEGQLIWAILWNMSQCFANLWKGSSTNLWFQRWRHSYMSWWQFQPLPPAVRRQFAPFLWPCIYLTKGTRRCGWQTDGQPSTYMQTSLSPTHCTWWCY